jgi:hypothetical protein
LAQNEASGKGVTRPAPGRALVISCSQTAMRPDDCHRVELISGRRRGARPRVPWWRMRSRVSVWPVVPARRLVPPYDLVPMVSE